LISNELSVRSEPDHLIIVLNNIRNEP